MKLIKLSDVHYVIVDNSTIKEGDWYLHKGKWIHKCKYVFGTEEPDIMIYDENESSCFTFDCKKITHSTQLLEIIHGENGKETISYGSIGYIPLSEVEEAIYGYSVKKMAEKATEEVTKDNADHFMKDVYKEFYIEGFKAHQKLAEFTIEDIKKVIDKAYSKGLAKPNSGRLSDIPQIQDEIIRSLFPKTEWNIKFVNGKIKLNNE